MFTLPFEIITITADFFIFIFIGYYFFKFSKKEKAIEQKEGKIDTNYHQIVDDALSKERKIIDDATHEADQIIAGAHYLNQASKETVDQALQIMISDIQKEAADTSRNFMTNYQASLQQITVHSIAELQNVVKGLETDLQKQVKDFHETMLPKMEKELEEYKQVRLKQTDQTITNVIQKVSQEILNKSLSLDDHEHLLVESLEKAKKEGAFG
ncbi:MAG TPA: hypothetical protein VLF89_02335 [Candidatus Saccharimonadales bacterium]|nr:hypothetical protein [Candidatus Saccharimonadales bacterium]HSW96642.1 hypothetical protein [Candidatus Saccharimonadales bacterium]